MNLWPEFLDRIANCTTTYAAVVGRFEVVMKERDLTRAVNAVQSMRLLPLFLQTEPLPMPLTRSITAILGLFCLVCFCV
jgi:hypothetical protein